MADRPILSLSISIDDYGVPQIKATYDEADAHRISCLLAWTSMALGQEGRGPILTRPDHWPDSRPMEKK